MSRLLSSSPRLFTQDSANRMLPLVAAISNELIPLWENVSHTRRRLQHITDSRGAEQGDPYSDEVTAMQERLELESSKVESLVDELRELGVEFKTSDNQAHVCFPTMLEGKLVYLSWCPGDLDVCHWLEFDAKMTDRKRLATTTLA